MNTPLAVVARPTTPHSRRRALLVAAACAAFGATACQPVGPLVTYGGSYTAGTITPDHGEAYTIVDQGTGFTAKAPKAVTHANLRLAVIKDTAPMSVDQSACITWNGPNEGVIQPGVVLRNHTDAGRTQAIMVTNNIMYGFRPGFNVHLATSTADPPLVQIGGQALTGALGGYDDLKPLPWRICARVQGTTVDVKAWSIPSTPTEPAWGDPTFGYSVQVPPDWVVAGRPGGYIAHLKAGQSATLTDLATSQITGTPGDAYWSEVLRWVDQLFTVTYARNPSPTERTAYAELVTRGTAPSTAAWLALTSEARQASGHLIHAALIGTASVGPPAQGWAVTYDAADVYAANLVASPDFPGGTTNEQFVAAVYQAVLGRAASGSDVAYHANRLNSGTTRTRVVLDIIRSNESRRHEVRSSARVAFGREATAEEISTYSAMWPTLGYDAVRLRAAMVASVAPVYQ